MKTIYLPLFLCFALACSDEDDTPDNTPANNANNSADNNDDIPDNAKALQTSICKHDTAWVLIGQQEDSPTYRCAFVVFEQAPADPAAAKQYPDVEVGDSAELVYASLTLVTYSECSKDAYYAATRRGAEVEGTLSGTFLLAEGEDTLQKANLRIELSSEPDMSTKIPTEIFAAPAIRLALENADIPACPRPGHDAGG